MKYIIIPISIFTGWSILGFRRGLQQYDYRYNKNKNDSFYEKKETYLYSTKLLTGLLGTFIYINPIFLFNISLKEIYRLEVNARNIEDEKNTNYYNELL